MATKGFVSKHAGNLLTVAPEEGGWQSFLIGECRRLLSVVARGQSTVIATETCTKETSGLFFFLLFSLLFLRF